MKKRNKISLYIISVILFIILLSSLIYAATSAEAISVSYTPISEENNVAEIKDINANLLNNYYIVIIIILIIILYIILRRKNKKRVKKK